MRIHWPTKYITLKPKEKTMTKADLVKLYAEAIQVPNSHAEEYLNRFGDIAAAELLADGEVPIPGIGKLVVTERAARKGRNPRTGKPVDIPAKKAVKLNVAKAFKDSLN